MNTISIFILIVMTASFLQCSGMAGDKEGLKRQITARIEAVDGAFAIAYRDLINPQNELFINEKEVFHAASTMKTPVMIEVFRQAELGRFSLSDSILVKNEFKSIVDGSTYSISIDRDGGDRLYQYLDKKVTIRDLVYDMITVSGNLATNILIDLVGAENVTGTMREIGAADIQVLRGVEDMKAFEKGLINTTTALDLLHIYEAIARNEILTAEACRDMIEILEAQEFRTKLPAKLPYNVRVAHKGGSITGVQHDAGIIFLPDGRHYVLVVLSKDLKNPGDGIEAIADISSIIYDYMVSI